MPTIFGLHLYEMDIAARLKNIDLYLLDQILKGRLNRNSRILDAGCGTGRNCKFLLDEGYDLYGMDPLEESLEELWDLYPNHKERFVHSTIEQYEATDKFDFVICNAVLHFADTHDHFQKMMSSLASLLSENGVLFIRMTSTFATRSPYDVDLYGKSELPDGTTRYLLAPEQLRSAMKSNNLNFVEPLKTINVNDQRSMSTFVLTNNKESELDIGWLDKSNNPMMK